MSEADYAGLVTAAHTQLHAPVILCWDNLNTHISGVMRTLLQPHRDWLTVVQMPAYAPDLRYAAPARRDREEPAQAHPVPARPHRRIPRPDRAQARTTAAITHAGNPDSHRRRVNQERPSRSLSAPARSGCCRYASAISSRRPGISSTASTAAFSLIPRSRTSPASHWSMARPRAWCIATARRASASAATSNAVQGAEGKPAPIKAIKVARRRSSAGRPSHSTLPHSTLRRPLITATISSFTVEYEAVRRQRRYRNPGNSISAHGAWPGPEGFAKGRWLHPVRDYALSVTKSMITNSQHTGRGVVKSIACRRGARDIAFCRA